MKQVLYFVASRGFQTPDIPETRGRLDGSPPPPVSRLGGSVVGFLKRSDERRATSVEHVIEKHRTPTMSCIA